MPMQVQESWLETPTMLLDHISLVLGAIFMCYGDEKGGVESERCSRRRILL